MENKHPLVSIVASCYNFEKFIPYFMESVLAQTYENWELVVTDDCSTDKSFEILKSYEKTDKRIKIVQNDKNRHVSHTLNNSLEKSTGEYICIMSCDDALLPKKLSHDVEFMENNQEIGVLYSHLEQVDENHTPSGNFDYHPPKKFDTFNLLRSMYLFENVLISPGIFIRKKTFLLAGLFNPLLKMTQDYDYHVKMLFNSKPAFNPVPLVQYRRMSDNSNLSNFSQQTNNSSLNEMSFILNNYLNFIKDYDLLNKIFPEVVSFGPKDNRLIPYYLGRLALNSNRGCVRAFGLQTIYTFMSETGNIEYLEKRVNFLPKDFMNLISEFEIYCTNTKLDRSFFHELINKIRFVIFSPLKFSKKYFK